MISAESEEPGRSSEIPPEPPKRPRIGTPHDMPGTSGQSDDKSKIGDEFVVNRPEQQQQQEFLQSSVEKVKFRIIFRLICTVKDDYPPILRHDIADDSVITLVLENVLRVIREMIAGAKLIMKQAERKKLLCDDLNDWLSRQG
ncbi:unnamed protein product, partial [Gongylonema pulchrum]|uniref:Histone domain-containing protein n=1 Tax=Gongylonema pulchrum TaxID=637853 RepID=A0A183D5Y6_9BILA